MSFVVKKNGKFYTGNTKKSTPDHSLLWTYYVQHARKYKKRGWAVKAAQKLNGDVVELQGDG